MTRLSILVLACIASLVAGPSLAKNDIRGVATAQPLADAVDTLELDGAICAPSAGGMPTVCSYDERTRMTLYAAPVPPNKVEKLVYTFHFVDIEKMRDKLQQLYGLRRDRIEGEHDLSAAERLDVELRPDGTGSLTITNDRLKTRSQKPLIKSPVRGVRGGGFFANRRPSLRAERRDPPRPRNGPVDRFAFGPR